MLLTLVPSPVDGGTSTPFAKTLVFSSMVVGGSSMKVPAKVVLIFMVVAGPTVVAGRLVLMSVGVGWSRVTCASVALMVVADSSPAFVPVSLMGTVVAGSVVGQPLAWYSQHHAFFSSGHAAAHLS